MLFPTPQFALFFLLVLTLYWSLPWRGAQRALLLVASYFFYGWWNWHYLPLIFSSTLIDYFAASRIAASDQPRHRRRWLSLSIAVNLGLLGFFKYYNFFQQNVVESAAAFGFEVPLPALEILLPVGISFYTFQSMAYTLEVYRGQAQPTRHLGDFMLFVSFFPQLVAGPICKAAELLPQIEAQRPSQLPQVSRATVLIASGLFKKMVLATFITTHLVDGAFLTPEKYGSLELWAAAWGYTAVVYCDFSGYVDLARGCALLLGFELPENFHAPYAATNIGEYWRRWHVTFSRWLREQVYLPLGGSRGGSLRTSLNLISTFLVGGLWHGAHWRFVLWGLIHGVTVALYKLYRDLRGRALAPSSGLRRLTTAVLGWLATMGVVVIARVFFRAPDLDTARSFLVGLFRLHRGDQGIESAVLLATLFALSLSFWGARAKRACEVGLGQLHPLGYPLLWAAVALALVALRPSGIAPYIYFQF